MFNLSGSEIVVILLLALVVLGPEKLPDAIRRAGRTYSELKKMGNSFQAEMKSVLDEPMKEMRETADLLKKSMDFTDGELTGKGSAARASAARTTTTAAAVGAAASTGGADVAAVTTGAATDGTTADAAPAPSDAPPPATATSPSDPVDIDDTSTSGAAAPEAPATPPVPTVARSAEDELIDRTLSGEA